MTDKNYLHITIFLSQYEHPDLRIVKSLKDLNHLEKEKSSFVPTTANDSYNFK